MSTAQASADLPGGGRIEIQVPVFEEFGSTDGTEAAAQEALGRLMAALRWKPDTNTPAEPAEPAEWHTGTEEVRVEELNVGDTVLVPCRIVATGGSPNHIIARPVRGKLWQAGDQELWTWGITQSSGKLVTRTTTPIEESK